MSPHLDDVLVHKAEDLTCISKQDLDAERGSEGGENADLGVDRGSEGISKADSGGERGSERGANADSASKHGAREERKQC